VRVLARPALPAPAEPAEIDRQVSASIGGGQPRDRLDTDAVGDLRPDLVLAQDLCAVGAVPPATSPRPWTSWAARPRASPWSPGALDEVLDGVLQVGRAAGVQRRAEEVVAGLGERLASVQAAVEAIIAVDASAFCSRPGPRLVDGVELLAAALHPGRLPPPPAGTAARLGPRPHQ
jgi:ABC-type Fe3+-hydroxamate transport system substrate-binding protein